MLSVAEKEFPSILTVAGGGREGRGGTGEKPEYMKDSDVKLAEKLLINNPSNSETESL